MNLDAMKAGWESELKGVPLSSRASRSAVRGYDQKDVDNMRRDIEAGATQTQAAKNNGIPRGSAQRFITKVN
tara:strand:+ start:2460 stop:2675 length:216 start_codon:yes stop_codon:yes gene_type:complete